jgi:hypothetical protein
VAAMTVIFQADALDRGGEPIHIDLGRGEHHLTDPRAWGVPPRPPTVHRPQIVASSASADRKIELAIAEAKRVGGVWRVWGSTNCEWRLFDCAGDTRRSLDSVGWARRTGCAWRLFDCAGWAPRTLDSADCTSRSLDCADRADGAGFEDVRLNSCSTEADIAFPQTLTPPGEGVGCIGIVTITPVTKSPIVIMISRSSRRRSSVQVRSVWKTDNLARACSFLMTFYWQVGIFAVLAFQNGNRGSISMINVLSNL